MIIMALGCCMIKTIMGLIKLAVKVKKDENWISGKAGTTEEYKDKYGRVVLIRTFNDNNGTIEKISTYYVYDNFGNIVYVLSPNANPDAGNIGSDAMANFCYQYIFDSNNRLTAKKLPGIDWVFMTYNKQDQIVATQDGNQRNKTPQEWSITKYDGLGRILISGVWQHPGSIAGTDYSATVQGYVDGQQKSWDNPTGLSNGNSVTWPASWLTTLIQNYYDAYPTNLPSVYVANQSDKSIHTQGLLTATQTSVLNDPGNMLWMAIYYDDNGRVIKSYKQHYLGGSPQYSVNNYDVVTNNYNFSNAVISSTRDHYIASTIGTPAVSIINHYAFDNAGRKQQVWEQINTPGHQGDNILIVQSDYNEPGQMVMKHFGVRQCFRIIFTGYSLQL